MSGPYEWVWEPGFSFEVTHIAGSTPVALEVGFGLSFPVTAAVLILLSFLIPIL
jgi:hypothetical protein